MEFFSRSIFQKSLIICLLICYLSKVKLKGEKMRKTLILPLAVVAVLFIIAISISCAKADDPANVPVTLWFSGSIEYWDGTQWQTFTKPTMTLSEGTYTFRFFDTGFPRAETDIVVSGTSVEKTIAYIRLLRSDGSGQPGASATWHDYGGPTQNVPGTTDDNGVLLCIMNGKHTDVLIDVTYEDATAPLKRQDPTKNSFYIFQMTKVTVELRNHIGDIIPESGVTVYYWPYGKPERVFGTLSCGTVSKDLLMPNSPGFLYLIKDFHKSSQQIGPTKNATVVFQTGKVIDGGFGCDVYWQYGGSTATFIDGIELLPGNFYFKDIQTNTVKNFYVKRGLVLILSTGTYLTPQLRYYLNVKTSPENITTIPGEGWYDKGTTVTLTAPEIVPVDEGTRYKFMYWEIDGTQQGLGINPIAITMDTNHTAIAYYIAQYYLKVISPYDTPGGEGWYDEGTIAYATLDYGLEFIDGIPYGFTGWSGDASGLQLISDPIVMNSSKVAIALWEPGDNYGDVRSIGFWRHQFTVWYRQEVLKLKGAGTTQIPATELQYYLDFIWANSEYFKEIFPGGIQLTEAYNILAPLKAHTMKDAAEQQLLAVWLNLARKAFFWNTELSQETTYIYYKYNLWNDMGLQTVGEAIKWSENELQKPDGNYQAVKDVCDSINNNLGIIWGT
jgi:hypothetical protein